MDAVAFATWLLGVRCLDASQRGRAFQELVLAEEHDTGASHNGIAVAAMTVVEAEAVPSVVRAGIVNAASGQDLLSQIRQGRLASFGCPHCGGDDIRPWGKASGKPRYRCVSCRKTFNPLTSASRLPSFSDRTEHLAEDQLCCQHLDELFDQRP